MNAPVPPPSSPDDAPARRVGLLIEYEGTDFVGWQRQAEGRSVQQTLEEALADLTGHAVRLKAAGRTDAGVHARGQVAAFDTTRDWPPEVFVRALPERLGDDVAVRAAWDAPDDFDPRGDAVERVYSYRLWNRPTAPVIDRRVWTHWREPLDFDRVRDASRRLVGKHDFAGFRSIHCSARRTRLTLARCEWTPVATDLWVMEIASRSFLRHMVRIVVGTLIEIGRGAEAPELVERILETGDRTLAGPTARPEGLTLERVVYPSGQGGG